MERKTAPASAAEGPSEAVKLTKMIEHWVRHNQDHARSFREWAEKARGLNKEDVARILEEVAEQSRVQNRKLEDALAVLKNS